MEKLKISRISGLMFVDIELWSIKENRYRNMCILLDTGASVTTISKYILAGLGYSSIGGNIMVTTASGMIQVQTMKIAKVKVGSTELENIDVYAHDFPDECFSDGVLGMNFLERFNMTLNLDENIMRVFT